jgi:hypothetical protein
MNAICILLDDMKPRIEQANAVLVALSTTLTEQPADKTEHVLNARLTLDVLLAVEGLLDAALGDCDRLGRALEAKREAGAP